MKLSQKKKSNTSRVLLFGAPKTGKTQLIGELAEHFNLTFFDLENGHETLFKLPTEQQERIELIELKDTRSYPIAIETCLKVVKGKPTDICIEHGKVGCMICKREQTDAEKNHTEQNAKLKADYFSHVDLSTLNPEEDLVVFDSLTQLSNSTLAHLLKDQADDYKPGWDEFMKQGFLLDMFLSHIQQAKYNVIVTSHEIEAETEGKKNVLVPVCGTRNFSRNVAKYFDHVIYCEKKNKKHVFASATDYANTIMTGSRTDVRMEDFTVPSLLAIFKPEVFKGEKKETAALLSKGGGEKKNTSDILAKLKNKSS